jgi:environmental stress-induced protein Ves
MNTDVRIIRRAEQSTGTWAGGTTTQLAIWPPDADYGLRNFKWRMSSARVDLEESPFTALPGVHRLIMILEGRVRLVHEGHHETTLDAFDQDAFEGEWHTLSYGRCVDFNLMLTVGCEGRIEVLKRNEKSGDSDAGRSFEIPLFASVPEAHSDEAEAFYCLAPRLEVVVREEENTFTAELERGDFMLLRRGPAPVSLSLENPTNAPFPGVRASVRYPAR